ncbi:MAG TPA: LysM domain-containing protein [Gemmatimonadales bacterium]|nr:LysM domain-containing protein [Gemmatimonadales bacterium]
MRALFLAAGLLAGAPVLALAQGGAVPETHTVRKGDTLWDLAKTYFGDPLVWPQIYKLNTAVVEDPHWIYPGEVLQLAGTGAGVIPTQPAADQVAPVAVTPEAAPPVAVAPAAEGPPPVAEAPPAAVEPEVYAEAPTQAPGRGVRGPGPIPGDPVALFGVVGEVKAEELLVVLSEGAYRALRPGEFYSAGFLTENQKLPFGEVLGDVEPPQVANLEPPTTASQFSRIGVIPPKGATYQVGDSLLIAELNTSYAGYGNVVWPTGIARVVEVGPNQTTALILNQFKRIRIGQVALPLERFVPGSPGRAVPVSDGIEAEVIQARSQNVLTEQQSILFLNKGRADGVAPGDVFELWRTPEARYDAAATVAEPMARVQIVRVGEHTSSALVVRIISSNIKPGTRAQQVARLPN